MFLIVELLKVSFFNTTLSNMALSIEDLFKWESKNWALKIWIWLSVIPFNGVLSNTTLLRFALLQEEFSKDDFILVGEKLKTDYPVNKEKWEKEDYPDIIGQWRPERIDNPELNPAHPDAPPFPIWNKRFEEINPKDWIIYIV